MTTEPTKPTKPTKPDGGGLCAELRSLAKSQISLVSAANYDHAARIAEPYENRRIAAEQELARPRAGIEALASKWQHSATKDRWRNDKYQTLINCADELQALLIPAASPPPTVSRACKHVPPLEPRWYPPCPKCGYCSPDISPAASPPTSSRVETQREIASQIAQAVAEEDPSDYDCGPLTIKDIDNLAVLAASVIERNLSGSRIETLEAEVADLKIDISARNMVIASARIGERVSQERIQTLEAALRAIVSQTYSEDCTYCIEVQAIAEQALSPEPANERTEE